MPRKESGVVRMAGSRTDTTDEACCRPSKSGQKIRKEVAESFVKLGGSISVLHIPFFPCCMCHIFTTILMGFRDGLFFGVSDEASIRDGKFLTNNKHPNKTRYPATYSCHSKFIHQSDMLTISQSTGKETNNYYEQHKKITNMKLANAFLLLSLPTLTPAKLRAYNNNTRTLQDCKSITHQHGYTPSLHIKSDLVTFPPQLL